MAPSRKQKIGTLHEMIINQDTTLLDNVLAANPGLTDLAVMSLMCFYNSFLLSDITPLLAAICGGYYTLCKSLIEEGADVNNPFMGEFRPLSLALDKNQYKVAKLLVQSGSDVNLSDSNGTVLPMWHAIKKDSPTYIVEEIISAGFSKNGFINLDSKDTALHKAVACDNIKVVKLLLAKSVNVNAANACLHTPLQIAVELKLTHVVRTLIKRGANVNVTTGRLPPLFQAINFDDLEMLNLLIMLGADINQVHNSQSGSVAPLIFALCRLSLKVVKCLLKAGAEVDAITPPPQEGSTALHVISSNEKGDQKVPRAIAEVLLEYGSDVNKKDNSGKTPLHLAIEYQNSEIAEVLVKGGANIHGGLRTGGRPYMPFFNFVSFLKNKDLIETFLKYGADFNAKDPLGMTPYHIALIKNESSQVSECVQLFWKNGCPYDQPYEVSNISPLAFMTSDCLLVYEKLARDTTEQQQFFYGVKQNNLATVSQALNNGAVAKGCSEKMKSPLHFVSFHGYSEIAQLLLELGVPPMKINDNGETPLHLAARYGRLQICKMLLRYGACYNYSSAVCRTTPGQLAHQNRHNEIVSCFKEINDAFIAVKKGRYTKVLQVVEDKVQDKDSNSVYVLINSVDKSGSTLMGTALKYGYTQIAQSIMHIRLSHC